MESKLIIFDWGGVIEKHDKGENNLNTAITNLITHFNNEVDNTDLVKKYHRICSFKGIDKRVFGNRALVKELKKEFNIKCNTKQFYNYYIKEFDKIEYHKDVVEYAHSLKEKCKIAILSNLGALDKQRLDKQVNLKKFDYVWLSFELLCRKPHGKIYEIVEKECKIDPQNILFIDDSQKNIETAQKRGWNTCNAYGYELDKIKESVNKFLEEPKKGEEKHAKLGSTSSNCK